MTYIDSQHKLFGYMDRLAAWQHGGTPAPVTVEWDLSNRCVLGCMDCHFAHTHTKGPWVTKSRMLPMAFDAGGDLADVELVKRGLEEMRVAGVRGVVWSGGGEPTTHPKWEEIVSHAGFVGLEQGMYTLGGLLTDRNAVVLGRHASWVVVSLDAADATTYSRDKGVPPERFEAACDGVRALVDAGTEVVGISFLLHEANWADCFEMVRMMRHLKATYATFRPAIRTSPDHPAICVDDRTWITEAIPTLLRLSEFKDVEIDVDRFLQYRDWSTRGYSECNGIKLTAVVTPDGRVWYCPQHRGVQGSCVGDLRVESFSKLWSRHPGSYTQFDKCRVMCRLHLMNETLSPMFETHKHEAFL